MLLLGSPGTGKVLPMYMGVIPTAIKSLSKNIGAPHVYGGDPLVGLRGALGL